MTGVGNPQREPGPSQISGFTLGSFHGPGLRAHLMDPLQETVLRASKKTGMKPPCFRIAFMRIRPILPLPSSKGPASSIFEKSCEIGPGIRRGSGANILGNVSSIRYPINKITTYLISGGF